MDNMEKLMQVHRLLLDVRFPPMFAQFFDVESEKMLDEKIEVLEALKAGKKIDDIAKFYDVLELMPKDGEIWD